ncbi:MAG: DUF2079 domain-containing protein [Synechococcus sp. SB0677_bin_5]|nr:DUF2079 domain-containing protein [Synechococcus sp. SB0677_bin_5]
MAWPWSRHAVAAGAGLQKRCCWGGGWLLFLAAGLYPILNNGNGVAAVSRYNHLCEGGCEGVGPMIRSALLDPVHLLGTLDWANILFYLFLLSLPLVFYWRRSSLPLLAATLPLLTANILSSSSAQRDLTHQYSLPIAILLVVASMDGLVADLRQGRLWLTRRLWFCYFWATLSWALLAKPGYFLDLYLSRADQAWPAHNLIRRIPSDAAVLTNSHLFPHLSHRPMVKQLFTKPLRKEELSQLDTALLNRHDPGWGSNIQHTAATIEQLQAMQWVCEEDDHSGFVLCQRPTS